MGYGETGQSLAERKKTPHGPSRSWAVTLGTGVLTARLAAVMRVVGMMLTTLTKLKGRQVSAAAGTLAHVDMAGTHRDVLMASTRWQGLKPMVSSGHKDARRVDV